MNVEREKVHDHIVSYRLSLELKKHTHIFEVYLLITEGFYIHISDCVESKLVRNVCYCGNSAK